MISTKTNRWALFCLSTYVIIYMSQASKREKKQYAEQSALVKCVRKKRIPPATLNNSATLYMIPYICLAGNLTARISSGCWSLWATYRIHIWYILKWNNSCYRVIPGLYDIHFLYILLLRPRLSVYYTIETARTVMAPAGRFSLKRYYPTDSWKNKRCSTVSPILSYYNS
jgi:hypothetical protein